ncbi:hypothetical protein BIU88_09095 [Chlorobaculum limnaeum]|uniref:Uncharacterized protein n=1 Tax=Chlorobaculum limnaeum TaxID=274537 RepID=A0A1D8CZD3_CHLLM|nr:hypothetical protein BIU88_09095 [Chlorobaculum limnaeum]
MFMKSLAGSLPRGLTSLPAEGLIGSIEGYRSSDLASHRFEARFDGWLVNTGFTTCFARQHVDMPFFLTLDKKSTFQYFNNLDLMGV